MSLTAKMYHNKWLCLLPFKANQLGFYCNMCNTKVVQVRYHTLYYPWYDYLL